MRSRKDYAGGSATFRGSQAVRWQYWRHGFMGRLDERYFGFAERQIDGASGRDHRASGTWAANDDRRRASYESIPDTVVGGSINQRLRLNADLLWPGGVPPSPTEQVLWRASALARRCGCPSLELRDCAGWRSTRRAARRERARWSGGPALPQAGRVRAPTSARNVPVHPWIP